MTLCSQAAYAALTASLPPSSSWLVCNIIQQGCHQRLVPNSQTKGAGCRQSKGPGNLRVLTISWNSSMRAWISEILLAISGDRAISCSLGADPALTCEALLGDEESPVEPLASMPTRS